MKSKKLIGLSFMIYSLSFVPAGAQTAPAFPGAEGHGRYVTGGRGGKIVHVTNLNDSGTGSFRAAVSGSDKKIVVFDVGGVIPLRSDLSIGANTTILGQTAPAPGITLRYYTVNPGGNNIIMRYIRIRRGEEKNVNDGADASTARSHTGLILDHCSFSWSIDEVASFYDNNNFTMQWCTIGESLVHSGHNKGPHGYGGIWGGKLASFHHNLILHVANRSPRFNGARYNWSGYTGNKLYSEYKWKNALQAENVDFRNCVVYNTNGCYGGPGGGQINMVGNFYKSGPGHTIDRLTTVTLAASGNAGNDQTFWDMTSRYYLDGNLIDGRNAAWESMRYDNGIPSVGGVYYTHDPKHYYGDDLTYTKVGGIDCLPIKLNTEAPAGEVTTHTAATAFSKVLDYAGASLHQDDVDERYSTETRNGTCTYKGSATSYVTIENGAEVTHKCTPEWGRIDLVSDVNGYTEQNFPTGSRDAAFDTDRDGIPDTWEQANGLNPNNATDASAYSLDPAKYYTNIEVYANALVQHIMLGGNSDAVNAANEYYPAYKTEDGTLVDAINTLGVNIDGGEQPVVDPVGPSKTYTVLFNGGDIESEAGFFAYGDGKHNFNTKFAGVYDGMTFSSGLKMEGTTVVKFSTVATSTVIIVQSTWSTHTLKFDNVELPLTSAETPTGSQGVRVYTLNDVQPGQHQITRGSGESGIFYVEIRLNSTSGISIQQSPATGTTAVHNLSGQRVNNQYKGIVIRDGKKLIVR